MNIIRKLTLRTMRKNPKRTIVTIMGIILATAMLTAVANLAESFRASIIHYMKETKGDYHNSFAGVAPENLKFFIHNRNIKKMCVVEEVGYALLADSENPDKPYLYISAVDENCLDMLPLKLTNGRWPEREDEIVISSHMRTNGGSRLTIGDTVTLQTGVREVDGVGVVHQELPYVGEEENFVPRDEKTYTIVGVMARPSYTQESYTSPGYTALTLAAEDWKRYAEAKAENMEAAGQPGEGWLSVYALYNKKGYRNWKQVREALEPLAFYTATNTELVRWESFRFSGNTMSLIYGMGGIAVGIILVSGVFCIRNSFQISLTEKLRLYGMLSSVGTTAGQRRKMVFYEAFYLGLIGIPLGVLSGVLATCVLIRVCSGLARDVISVGLIYVFSVPAVIAGVILAVVTIFFSAFQSARKAAKLSPISAIRSQETIRRGRKNLRVPFVITKLFGIGGVLAYKNLRRSKVKYRTTMISIAVSVTVFIAMNTFLHLGIMEAGKAYEMMPYPLTLMLYDEDRDKQAERIRGMEEVQESTTVRHLNYAEISETEQIAYTEEYRKLLGLSRGISLYCMDAESYEKYCGRVGISPEEAAEGAILCASFRVGIDEGQGLKYYEGTIAEFEKGRELEILINSTSGTAQEQEYVRLPIACQTDVQPKFLQGSNMNRFIGIVNEAWAEEHMAEYISLATELFLQCEDAEALEQRIRTEIPLSSYYFNNYERIMREQRSMWLLIAIFLYGFITVISLIGVTNIFNTVTTNMELRSREFAMLRSVGMTGREFRRMVRLESIFYGGEALLFGIPAGCVLSALFYRVLGVKDVMRYELPVSAMLISIAAVAVLLFGITRYSMGKINRKNIIETIQNENI